MAHGLIAYRRHTQACVKQYPKDYRILVHWPLTKDEQRVDCECPIAVSGSLRLEDKRIRHVSTGTTDIVKALQIAKQWEGWEALTNPDPTPAPDMYMTLEAAIEKHQNWLGPTGKNLAAGSLKTWRVHFEYRLRPFCQQANIRFVRAFDNLETVRDCVLSWRKADPYKAHKGNKAPLIDEPLGSVTKRNELEKFREFLEFGKENGWLRHNHAAAIEIEEYTPSARYGLLPEEEDRLWAYLGEAPTGRRWVTRALKRRQFRALNLVLRHAGLRIGDATKLNDTQLVNRAKGVGFAIKILRQGKTKRWVRIPIPLEVAEILRALPFTREENGLKYWFWGGASFACARNDWERDIRLMMNRVQAAGGRFQHPASAHTWRHTFAIAHLNAGTPIEFVSQWLGHTNIRTSQNSYGHANEATHVASEIAYDTSLKRQQHITSLARHDTTENPTFG